ncbi:Uncharacterised protein [Serratia fonticola]|uniref:Uncharacterized protein n=1 Tax=Serratia fonticola TaxID=47917 RepID=A0A3S4X6B7_SERFO|nr:Uncharacterised protein [Serratia fonticola]VEI66460.1 Uncharacterised protein [Serratia fonticola]
MQVNRPLNAGMRDSSPHGRVHGVSVICMTSTCNTIRCSNQVKTDKEI